MNAWDALRTKPSGSDTAWCRRCNRSGAIAGKTCRWCQGWGWYYKPGYCSKPATGRKCVDCKSLKNCHER